MNVPLEYIDLDAFAFKWRFAEDASRWSVLSDKDISQFRPLSASCSRSLWYNFFFPSAQHLMEIPGYFPSISLEQVAFEIDVDWTSSQCHEKGVQFFRQNFHVLQTSQVFFFWNASCGVETTWDLFLRYWTDSCYPSDDSIVIVPVESDKNVVYIEGRIWIMPRMLRVADFDP